MKQSILPWVIVLAVTSCVFADELSDFEKQQAAEMNKVNNETNAGVKAQKDDLDQYMAFTEKQFQQWQAQQQKEFDDFKNNINKEWGSFEEPSNKKWVEYGKDTKTVASVDFEKGVVVVVAIKQKGETTEQATKRLVDAVARIATSQGSRTAAPVETSDPKKSILSKPILLGQLTTPDNKPITKDNVAAVVKVAEIKETITPLPNNTGAEKVSITLALAPNHIKKRAEPFIQFVKTYSAQRGVDADHILGTIHTESFFNPAARSGCGALGLMQLMPQSGGAEAYAILKGKGMIPSAAYLYDPEKNIELGCIYIGMLESKYFGNVKSKNSRTFCSIAAYNTGPGNVAFTFTGKRKVDPAVMIINNMPDSVVYATMVEKLPFAETRGYLKMVYERMPLYR